MRFVEMYGYISKKYSQHIRMFSKIEVGTMNSQIIVKLAQHWNNKIGDKKHNHDKWTPKMMKMWTTWINQTDIAYDKLNDNESIQATPHTSMYQLRGTHRHPLQSEKLISLETRGPKSRI